MHLFPFIRLGLGNPLIKSKKLGVPKVKKTSNQLVGMSDENVMATVAPPLTLPDPFKRGTDDLPCKLLHRKVDQNKGKGQTFCRKADPKRDPLLGNSPFWRGWLLRSLSRFEQKGVKKL